jgi:Xaa-Pro aminopeptidase
MRNEISRLLGEQNLDVLWVTGATHNCPEAYYLTGGVSLTSAWIILRPDTEALLCHSAMEREAAGASGLRTLDFNQLGAEKLSQKHSDQLTVRLEMFARLAERENLAGRVAVHGTADPGESHFLLEKLSRRLGQIEFVRDIPPVLETARATKDPEEIQEMKKVARAALEAMSEALELIRTSHAEGDQVTDSSGAPVTVGAVKACVSTALARKGLQEPFDTILSIGRESGIPHATNPDDTVLAVGKTVVFDLFPCRKGGGYFFDITRSFVIGNAPEEALRLYEEVLAAQEKAIEQASAGVYGSELQELVCDHFEELGHPTIRSKPGPTEGYVHSLGHGIGLEVHEHPYLRLQEKPDESNRLKTGSVFSIEPGLYYPERGMGVRIEDPVYINQSGSAEILAPFEKFPVLELEG